MFVRPATLRTALRRIPSVRPAVMEAGKVRQYTEGATGSGFSRAGGEAGGDSFTKREKANEDYFIKRQESERLKLMREKLAASRKHLDDLENHLNEIAKDQDQGGERH